MEKARQNRNQQSASKAAGSHVIQQKHENRGTPEFADNRPEAAAQRRLIETIKNSPKARAAAQFKSIIRNSSNLKQVAQRATAIKHEAGSIKFGTIPQEEQLVGKKMEAELDAADPVVGTATGTQWTWTRRMRNLFRGAGVVRGHLLNHDLGGHAIPENLYPISTKANSDHSAHVEQPVKKLLNEAADDIKKNNGGHLIKDVKTHYVSYSVTVAEDKTDDPTKATFKCAFGVGTNPKTQQDIRSELDVDKDRYNASAGLIPGQSKVTPLVGWAHTGKFQPGKTAIDTTRISATIPGKLSSLPGPELVKGSAPNYQLMLESLLVWDSKIAERTAHTTTFATYRVDQGPVWKHLLALKSFCDDLEDISASLDQTNLPAIENILKDATKAAAKSISPLKLPRSAMKQPYKKIAAKAKNDMHLLYVYYAVKTAQPNVSVKDIKGILQANFASSTNKKEVILALRKLADLKLVQVKKGKGWNTL